MMTMKPEEIRQLRSWAISTVLQTRLQEENAKPLDMAAVLRDARKLVNFVRAS